MGTHRSLYDEAFDRFKKSKQERYTDPKEVELLKEFLRENATPEETKIAAEELQAATGKKYGGKKLADVEIPESWITNIMENIDNFITAGDYLTEGAPESVGLAWYAVKLTLTAIHSNYELYKFFGTALSDISEIMIIVRHYDRLYDERGKKNWKPSPLVEKLFQDVTETYVAVLDFSFAVKRHITAGSFARLKHGLKDFFGSSKGKFEEKRDTIASLKKKILEGSQGAFQDKTLTQLEGVSTVVADIADSIKQFETFHHKIDLITQRMDEMANNTKRKSPWDFALDDYKAYQEALQPLEGCRRVLGDTIDALVAMPEGTCRWVFEEPDYETWERSDECEMLCITGQEGTGKSYVMASIVRQFLPGQGGDDEDDDDAWNPDTAYLYVTCNPDAKENKDQAITSTTVLHTLLSQLYELALETKNASFLESCSAVFKAAKANLQNAQPHERERMSEFPQFVEGFCKLVRLLQRDVVVVVDGITKSTIEGEHQRTLLRELRSLRAQADNLVKNHILILVGCSSPTTFQNDYQHDEDFPNQLIIDVGEGNGDDLRAFLANELNNIPGLTAKEREEATVAILDKAQSKFSYLVKTALPFMKEPFQRPLSKRLLELPGGLGDVYSKALRSLKPNYVGLLKTALTWVMLAKDNQISAREVMDDFQGTYASPVDDSSTNDIEDGVVFGDISSLEREQLLQAAEGILKLSFVDDRFMVHAPLGELDDIEDFFCSSNEEMSEADDGLAAAGLCAKCKASDAMHKALRIDAREGHVQLALSCLRHLNHPLFQKRAGLVSIPESKVPDYQMEVLPPQQLFTQKMIMPLENSEDEEDVIDPSRFDLEEFGLIDHEDSESSSSEEEPTQHVRYELLNWAYHVRKAEELLSPEERAGSSLWAELMTELDTFSSNTGIFFAWQTSLPAPNPPEEREYTLASGSHKPLHVAAFLGLTSWAEHLLEGGADVNEVSNGFNPAQVAASAGDSLQMMRLLLEKGADPNARSKWGWNTFHYWMSNNQELEGVQLLLQHGADPRIKNEPRGWNALHLFSRQGTDPAVLDTLLEHGVEIDAPEGVLGFTAFHIMLGFRPAAPEDLLLAFIKHKADINAENLTSARPLQILATRGQVKNMEILLREGVVEIDDTDVQGTTALQEAIASWHIDAARLLLEHGADPEFTDTLKRTSLHLACRRGATEIAKLLIDHGCDVNIVDVHGWTPFFIALLGRNEGNHKTAALILDTLVQREISLADINKPGRSGRTALRQAASRGFDDIVSKLIQVATERNDMAGLDIDVKDGKKGMTALHRASLGGHVECVRLLLEAKADASIQDTKSRTALVLAYEQWAVANTPTFEDTISLLIDADHSAAIQDSSLLAICAANGSLKLLKQLWALNADFSRPDQFGWRPIELVRNSGSEEAEEFLQQQDTWVKNLPSRWSTSLPGATILGAKSVQEDGITIQHSSAKKVTTSADKPLPPGLDRYYYEITIKPPPPAAESEILLGPAPKPPKPLIALGFSSVGGAGVKFPGDATMENDPNPDAKTWAYNSRAGEIYASDGSGTTFIGQPYGEAGDVIGVGVDLAAREMWATKNGVKVGVYDDEDGAVSGRLFPIVGFGGLVQFEVNFGGPGREFVWKGEEDEGSEGGDEGDEEGDDEDGVDGEEEK